MTRKAVCLLIAVTLSPLLPVRGQDAAAHVQNAARLMQRGDVQGTIRECKAALAVDERDAAAHMLLGQAYLAQASVGMIAEAKAELQQAIALDPNLVWARFYLAKIYIDLGAYEKARDQLEQGLHTRPRLPYFLSLLGDVRRRLGDPDAAIQLNRQALELDPTLSPAHYYIALACLDRKDEDAAIRELESAVASKYVVPDIYVTLAKLYLARGKLAEAEALCRKALALDASHPETYVAMARVYNTQGASDRAIAAAKSAFPPDRGTPATAYYQQLEADAYFELGIAYEAKRMKPQAIDAYARSLDLDPSRAEARRRVQKLR